MEITKLDCPHCGASLEPKDGLDTFFCTYCGGKIILADMSDAAYKAKVDIKKIEKDAELHEKDLEHSALMKDKEHSQERFRLKQSMTIGLVMFLGNLIIMGALGGIALIVEVNNKSQLKRIDKQINEEIKNGDYDSALITANQIYNISGMSSQEAEAWEKKREQYINIILEKKRETDKEGVYIEVPDSAKELEGKKYDKVVEKFKTAGFENVSAQKTSESKGLFDWSDTVEHISISGKKDFIKGETYEKNSSIVVYYYYKD